MTAPDPRLDEIQARAKNPTYSWPYEMRQDITFLLAELRKAHEALRVAQFVASEWEAELLNLKGPCRATGCRLHYAHRGPCAAVAAAKGDEE